jgi:hypothetical protein
MSAKPRLVTPPLPEPTPARAALEAAQTRRQRANDAVGVHVAAQQHAETLVTARARLQQLEDRATVELREWAISGLGSKPEISDGAEIRKLRAELANAPASVAQLRDAVTDAQAAARAATEDAKQAVSAVLIEEGHELLNALDAHVTEARRLHARALALVWFLQKRGAAVAPLQQKHAAIGDAIAVTDDRVRADIRYLEGFADKLLADAAAEMEGAL